MNDLLKRRFEELAKEATAIQSHKVRDPRRGDDIDPNRVLNWKVKAKSLIGAACGPNSVHLEQFDESCKPLTSWSLHTETFERMLAVFMAAREDYEGGYLLKVRTLVQAEMFDTELDQASEFLKLGYKVPAAVVAGVVLETALRELCCRNKIEPGKLERMNEELTKAEIYNANKRKQITAFAATRNSAAHGHQEEFEDHDVKLMITGIEQFLGDYLP